MDKRDKSKNFSEDIGRIIKEDKFYLGFLEKFDMGKTKTFSRKKIKTRENDDKQSC